MCGRKEPRPLQRSSARCPQYYQTGACGSGDRCALAHSMEEARLFEQTMRSQVSSSSAGAHWPAVLLLGRAAAYAPARLPCAARAQVPRPAGGPPAPPPVQQPPPPPRPSAPLPPPICKYYARGHCKMGRACEFRHGAGEPLQHLEHPLYKTQLCAYWMEQGRCHKGPSCTYAHGHAELRPGPGAQPPPPAVAQQQQQQRQQQQVRGCPAGPASTCWLRSAL